MNADSCPAAAGQQPAVVLQSRQDSVRATELNGSLDQVRRLGSLARATMPVGGDGWLALSYDSVRFVLSDPRFSVWEHRNGDYPRVRENEGSRPPFPPSFVLMDPPDHTERRRLLTKHFSVKRVRALQPRIESTVQHYLRVVTDHGPGADLVRDFSAMVPVAVACDLLGAPVEERHRFLPAASALITGDVTGKDDSDRLIETINDYFGELLEARRAAPGEDLISAMVSDPEVREVWTEDELRGVGFVLLFAGHDATAAILGGVLRWLAHEPAAQEVLRSSMETRPAMLEELIRYFPAGLGTRTRIAMEDVEYDGVRIRAGEAVLALPQAANFDPAAFESPGEIDLDERRPNPHVRFGHGIHSCVGQQLARAEIRTALHGVLATLPDFRAVEGDPEWRAQILLRGPASLPVTW